MGLAGEALERFIESHIFFPDRILVQGPQDVGMVFEDVFLETSDGLKLHGWFVPAPHHDCLFLFCHGNAGNISHRLENIEMLNQIGFSVFIFDYRGYGRSQGRITEQGFYLDAEAAYLYCARRAESEKTKLVIFGRSLGGVAAVHLASSYPCSGVIVESTFPHLGAMAKRHFFLPGIGNLLSGRLNAIEKIRLIQVPLLVIHGDQDDIVPIELGRELFHASETTKSFFTIEGAGHNDTFYVARQAYFDRLKDFVRSLPRAE